MSVKTIVLFAGLLGLASIFVFVRMPSNTPFWNEIENAGHAPLFGCLALIALALLRTFSPSRINRPLSAYASAFVCASVLGALSELWQYTVGRDAEYGDWVNDMIGALAFLAICWTIDKTVVSRSSTVRSRTWTIRITAVVLLTIPAIPAMTWGAVIMHRNSILPRLAAFDSPLERKLFETRDAVLSSVPPPAGWTEKIGHDVGRVTFHPATYPSLLFDYFYPKWDGYRSLSFDVYSNKDTAIDLVFRIYDAGSTGCYYDRFNTVFSIAPGPHHIDLPLDTIKVTPWGRQMQMDHTAGIILFLIDPKDTVSLYLDDFRLN